MNKILFSLVFALLSFPTYACAQNSQEELCALVQRVDSLEHELSYLKLNCDLRTLNYDITALTNEVMLKCTEVKIDIYHRNFDSQYVDMHKGYYEMFQRQKGATLANIESTKKLFHLKVLICPYSKEELDVLNAYYDRIDVAYDGLELAIDYFRALAEGYAKNL